MKSRTITWEEPGDAATEGLAMTGLEYLRAMADGRLPGPPIGATMGMMPGEFETGRAVFFADPGEYHYNPIGTVHGGLAATLLDSAMSCAVHTTQSLLVVPMTVVVAVGDLLEGPAFEDCTKFSYSDRWYEPRWD